MRPRWCSLLITLATVTLVLLIALAPAAFAQDFGSSVSISGSLMAVGWPSANQVDVYQLGASGWTQVATLAGSDTKTGDMFGYSVSIFNKTVLIGAPGWPAGGNQGAAYVFNQPNGLWKERAELTASAGAPGDYFGASVGVNGSQAVVGAPGNNTGYVFVQPNTHSMLGSTQTAELSPSDAPLSFGAAVEIAGTTAMVGSSGAVYTFTEPAGGWANMTETTEISPP